METNKTRFQKVFKFEGVATLIGLIADIFTIGSILFALRLPDVTGKPLPFFITPALALAIWVIGLYVYFSLLHSFWEKNKEKNNFQEEFPVFLLYDLLIKFRSPFALLPAIIFIILYIFIVSDKFYEYISPLCISGLVIVGVVCLGIILNNVNSG